MRSLLVISFLLLVGCGNETREYSIWDCNSNSRSILVQQVIDRVNSLVPQSVDPSDYSISLLPYQSDVAEACPRSNPQTVLGCTHIYYKDMYSMWAMEHRDYDNAKLNGLGAQILAHELGHLYFFQTEGNSDNNHSHSWWFDHNNPSSITGTIQDIYSTSEVIPEEQCLKE